jgi:hypothetical protein
LGHPFCSPCDLLLVSLCLLLLALTLLLRLLRVEPGSHLLVSQVELLLPFGAVVARDIGMRAPGERAKARLHQEARRARHEVEPVIALGDGEDLPAELVRPPEPGPCA